MSLQPALAAHAARVALLLGVALAAMPLLRRARPSLRRLVAALALGGALLLPAVTALAPSLPILPRGARALAAPFGEPFAEPLVAATDPTRPVVARDAARRATVTLTHASDFAALAIVVWAFGALAVIARLSTGLLRARGIVRRSRPAPGFARALAEAAQRTGVRIDVRLTEELDAPAVAGIATPTVLVPANADADADGWTEERRLAVLLHEIAHVRQRDCLVQVVAQLTCAAHWFDPLAWALARRLRRERELSADDAVIAAGVLPTTYAEALLAIGGAHAAPVGAVGMADGDAGGSELGARVTSILAARRARGPLSPVGAGAIVAAVASVSLAIACGAPDLRDAAPGRAPLGPAALPLATAAPSTLEPRLQRIAEEELDRTLGEWQGAAGAIVVLDPATGEVLANAGREHGAPADVGAQRAFVTGSTLKTILLAAALEQGAVAPSDRFETADGTRAYGTRTLRDASPAPTGVLTLSEMLATSSNVGFSKVFDRLGGAAVARWLGRFHFGAAPGSAVPRVEDGSYEGAMLAMGEAMRASPLQVAAAYATLANDGVYLEPTTTRRSTPAVGEPVLAPATARLVVRMLEAAVTGERATGGKARVANARVAGKTGTADEKLPDGRETIYASFAGIVASGQTRWVIVVGVESPREGGWGGTVAAPAFARVASRALGG